MLETIALLYALRLWSRFLATYRASVRARSDSNTALSLLASMSSSSSVLNFVGAHLAIELESSGIDLIPEHIFGKWNSVPDSLSRKFVPGTVDWSPPSILADAKEVTRLCALDEKFWLLPCPSVAPRLWEGAAASSAREACLESIELVWQLQGTS